MVTDEQVADFDARGFIVLRRAFDPGPLSAEVDQALREGLQGGFSARLGDGEVQGHYVPMMTARTPVSRALLDRLAGPAARLLGGPVLPTRAKAVRYLGDTPWHVDSSLAVASVGVAAYLEPLTGERGALRVLPGSHRPELAAAAAARAVGEAEDGPPGHVVATEPGDLIFFDEHLLHASAGGAVRRQWRIDYLRDPQGADAEAEVRRYFAGIFPPTWDGGHDVDLYPSYGPDWSTSRSPAVARLAALGVYALAAAQEAFVRSRRGPSSG